MQSPSEVNHICDPDYEIQPGEHAHLCDECGTCWRHTSDLAYDETITQWDYAAAHKCPSCGREQRRKHYAHEPSIDYIIDELARSLGIGDKL